MFLSEGSFLQVCIQCQCIAIIRIIDPSKSDQDQLICDKALVVVTRCLLSQGLKRAGDDS
jgi:hypothetical protein